ncbi:MAG: 4Fe-4S dicluster domain-containing protein [Candidatus Eisenbacteria bacterium]
MGDARRVYDTPFGCLTIDPGTCTGCEACLPVCPYGVLSMAADGTAMAEEPDSCTCCSACRSVCPVDAITVTVERSRSESP